VIFVSHVRDKDGSPSSVRVGGRGKYPAWWRRMAVEAAALVMAGAGARL